MGCKTSTANFIVLPNEAIFLQGRDYVDSCGA